MIILYYSIFLIIVLLILVTISYLYDLFKMLSVKNNDGEFVEKLENNCNKNNNVKYKIIHKDRFELLDI